MEKVSINDLLSLLLPGLFLFVSGMLLNDLCPHYFIVDLHNVLSTVKESDVFSTIFFLLVCIICGAVVQGVTYFFISSHTQVWYNRLTGLYTSPGHLFCRMVKLHSFIGFYNRDCMRVFNHSYNTSPAVPVTGELAIKKQDDYFDYIYYYMVTHNKIDESRSQQNFYFLFRNLFTVCALMSVCAIFLFATFSLLRGAATWRLLATGIAYLVVGYAVFVPLARWYRKRMVQRLFYQYYILRNSNSEQTTNIQDYGQD
ncbi:MAG: hypothetical protein KF744_18130 [Taibaiella sp.]|nr:hypothetical protein [Taibaiella sp.]